MSYPRAAAEIGPPAVFTVALIVGAFKGMTDLDWALLTACSFLFVVSAVLRYRRRA